MMTASKMGPKNIYQSNKYGFFFTSEFTGVQMYKRTFSLEEEVTFLTKKINAIPECVKVELGPKHTHIA